MTERRVNLLSRWPMVLWLTVVWVLFWGDLSVANVLAGIVLGAFVMVIAPMPRVGFEGRPWLPGIVVLLVRFFIEVVHASVQIAAAALKFGTEPHGAVIRIKLRSHSDLWLTFTSVICSLVPGSIIVEAQRTTGTLYVHVFDVTVAGGLEKARAQVLAIEERVLYAFASAREIEAAGLPPRGLLRRRKEVAA